MSNGYLTDDPHADQQHRLSVAIAALLRIEQLALSLCSNGPVRDVATIDRLRLIATTAELARKGVVR